MHVCFSPPASTFLAVFPSRGWSPRSRLLESRATGKLFPLSHSDFPQQHNSLRPTTLLRETISNRHCSRNKFHVLHNNNRSVVSCSFPCTLLILKVCFQFSYPMQVVSQRGRGGMIRRPYGSVARQDQNSCYVDNFCTKMSFFRFPNHRQRFNSYNRGGLATRGIGQMISKPGMNRVRLLFFRHERDTVFLFVYFQMQAPIMMPGVRGPAPMHPLLRYLN